MLHAPGLIGLERPVHGMAARMGTLSAIGVGTAFLEQLILALTRSLSLDAEDWKARGCHNGLDLGCLESQHRIERYNGVRGCGPC